MHVVHPGHDRIMNILTDMRTKIRALREHPIKLIIDRAKPRGHRRVLSIHMSLKSIHPTIHALKSTIHVSHQPLILVVHVMLNPFDESRDQNILDQTNSIALAEAEVVASVEPHLPNDHLAHHLQLLLHY